MPYRDADKQREYQRHWKAQRRAEWFVGKTCQGCGAAKGLEIHHANPEEKLDHRIWSWSPTRLETELAKCIVLCRSCHENEHWGPRLSEIEGAHAWLAEYDRRRHERLERRRAKRLRTAGA